MDNSIDFDGTDSKFYSIEHFYMLMNNSGLTFESGRNGKMLEYVENMSGTDIEYIRCYIHEGKLKALAIKYTSSDTKTIQATIKEKDCNDESLELKGPDSNWTWSDDGTWSIKVVP